MQATRVYELNRKIPTYISTSDDKNPMFDMHGRCLNPYPYTQQNGCTTTKESLEYTIVVLENNYLLIEVLPQLGGRVQRILDKRNNKDVFYYNKEISPQLVGTRGSWFAGGIEFNTPISHSPTSYDIVHYVTHQDISSASITFGTVEQISSMNWQITLTLHDGSAYLEQKVEIQNPTPYENRYYFWTNAAIQDTQDLKLVYPFDWCMNHLDDHYIKWPYYEKIDYRNGATIPSAYETFGKTLTENYFGVYYSQEDFGIVHYADRKSVKGAKFFAWGKDDLGKSWNHALTKSEDEYLEIQSGLFETQSVFNFIKPYQQLEWKEYWYPIHSLGNLTYADECVAMNHAIANNSVDMQFIPIKEFKKCKLTTIINGNVINANIDLLPEQPTKISIPIPDYIKVVETLVIEIRKDEDVLLLYGERDEFMEEYPSTDLFEDVRMNRDNEVLADVLVKIRANKELTKEEIDKLYNRGKYKESRGEEEEAFLLYETNLLYYPHCNLTKKRLSILYIKKEHYQKAKTLLQEILKYNNCDNEARFFMAIVIAKSGDLRLSRKLMYDISSQGSLKKASVAEIAKIDIMLGYYREVITLLKDSPYKEDAYIKFLLGIAYRNNDQPRKAKELLDDERISSPYLLTEKYMLKIENSETIMDSIEVVSHLLLSIIREYAGLNCYEEVIELLKLVKKPNIIHKVYQQYAVDKLKDSIKDNQLNDNYFDCDDVDVDIDYCFFKDSMTAHVIRIYEPKDTTGRLTYLLGNYYYGINDFEKARECFIDAYNKGLKYTVLLRNLGYIYYNRIHDLEKACRYLEEDLKINTQTNEDSLMRLSKIYIQLDNKEKQNLILPLWDKVENKTITIYGLVSSLIHLQRYEEAIVIMNENEFLNWEGKENNGDLYQGAYIGLINEAICNNDNINIEEYINKIIDFPLNLQYGDSMRKPLSHIHYVRGNAYKQIGKIQEAKNEFKLGYDELLCSELILTDYSKNVSIKCLKSFKELERNYPN